MPRAIISAGHTSTEKGAEFNGLVEYELTRKIADYVILELRKLGVLTLSVPGDLDLASRIEWINNSGYNFEQKDVAVEIHINDGGKSGIEGWYRDKGETESFKLTKSIVDRVCSGMDLTYQGVKSEYEHSLKQLAFVHMLNPVPALVECLYIDNDNDRLLLQDESKLNELGRNIAEGVMDYWKFNVKADTVVSNQSTNDISIAQQQSIVSDSTLANPQVANNQVQGNLGQQPIVDNGNTSISPVAAIAAGAKVGSMAYDKMQNSQTSIQSQVPAQGQVAPQVQVATQSQVNSQAQARVQTQVAPQNPVQFSQAPISFEERERRRLFVEDLYSKALGRKPTFQETAYFINNWSGEVDLVKRMLDSQDHADILGKAIDFAKVQEEMKEKDNVVSRLKIEVRDKDGIIENLNKLVIEKNMMINDLKKLEEENLKIVERYNAELGYKDEKTDSFIKRFRKSIKEKL